jgi:hypothetical protein
MGRAFSSRVSVIWFACVWCIWKARNAKCFHNKEIIIEKLVEEVKVLSWNWLRFKSKNLDFNLQHWCVNPRALLGDMRN